MQINAWSLLILIAAIVPQLGTAQQVQSFAPIASSIITFYPDLFTNNGQRCIDLVDKAAAVSGADRLMFVPTAYYLDTRPTITWKDQSRVDALCYQSGACTGATKEEIQQFERALTACFGRAIFHGFHIAITPHLDDAAQKGLWRNGAVFSPNEKTRGTGNFTYTQVILDPMIRALNAVRKPTTKIWFGLQGEMSACVFMRPLDWLAMVSTVKTQFGNSPNVKVGISTNFNKLCHCLHVDIVDTGLYLKQFTRDFAQVKGLVNVQGLRQLYNGVDFFGISSYPSMNDPNFPTYMLENAAREFDAEMSLYGINIRQLMMTKEFIFAEYGLGGGKSQNGDERATTAAEAAKTPFFTIFNYTPANNPWAIPAVRDYRRRYFTETIRLLSGNAPGSQYKIMGVYNWNLGTYDFQGISNTLAFDADMAQQVRAHNLALRGN